MKKFFLSVLASTLGSFFAITLSLSFMSLVILSAFLFTGERIKKNFIDPSKKTNIKNKKYSVLKIELQGNIVEHSSAQKQIFNMIKRQDTAHTLLSLTELIAMAKKNKKIKGIYLKINNFTASWSVLNNLKNQLLDFKKSGKFIVSFSENLSEKHYLLASTANKIVLYPEGHIEWNGFHAQFTSVKELLDKLKIQMYVFRTGKFKSAVEPLLNKTISQENRLQIQNLINNLWSYLLNEISRPQVNKKVLNRLAKEYLYLSPKEALKYNLIDSVGSEWKAFSLINQSLNETDLSQMPLFYKKYNDTNNTQFQKLLTQLDKIKTQKKDGSKECIKADNKYTKLCKEQQVAVLYLDGEIQYGQVEENKIGSFNTVKILRKIKKNKNIKALVIRINSPGGSALASDIIWSEIEELKKHIPVVTSISGIAASGGYYLSAGSKFIFAEPSSIIGSIGVFFVRPYTAKLTEHLGVYSQTISTHKNIELFNTSELLSPLEQDRINKMLQKTYDKFKYVIKKGRNLSDISISNLATGRYWLSKQALKTGLIDKIGSLSDAKLKAAELAHIKIFSVLNYPQDSYFNFNFLLSIKSLIKNNILSYFNMFGASSLKQTYLQNSYLLNLKNLDPKGILTIMPYPIIYK